MIGQKAVAGFQGMECPAGLLFAPVPLNRYSCPMTKSLYLIDCMALIYRAHFALIKSPIFTSSGLNTSALYGFTNALLDLLEQQKPELLAIATDTPEPTARHIAFPAYKAQREDMPEDIASALPHIDRLAAALGIPLLRYPGFEADDIIGTVAVAHASPELQVVMVTPDKDFAQLVRPHVSIYRPGRMGKDAEILGVEEVKKHWEVPEPIRVADVLGLWGDASDNIPGVPGFGEKTAKKLISQYGSIEGIYAHIDEIKGKQREKLEEFKDQAFLCRQLATIDTKVPVKESVEDLHVKPRQDEELKKLLVEFEFNSIGRRIYGPDFKAGRGSAPPKKTSPAQGELFAMDAPAPEPATSAHLRTIADVPHEYLLVDSDEETTALVEILVKLPRYCFDIETDRLNPKLAKVAGIAFSWEKGKGYYVRLPADAEDNRRRLGLLSAALGHADSEKIGHNLKFDISVLLWNGIAVQGPLFDTMIAHSLLEPDRRHGMDALSEQYLGYTPIAFNEVVGEKGLQQTTMFDAPAEKVAEYAAEDADVTWQLYEIFSAQIREQGLDPVFREIEMPLLPVIIRMEKAGIRLDREALATASKELAELIAGLEVRIFSIAGESFNLNSPRQLGEILFDKMKLMTGAKKTKTGQYATDESILSELATDHEIARLLLEYREASKLKSTYVDALPEAVYSKTGRIHTTFSQTGAITGRLASSNPNLQNIPIRSSLGQDIRAAFVASEGYELLSADYSQIELRVMASLSGDPGMIEAFENQQDIHAATAARVYRVDLGSVTSDMRRKAKMVNFGIIYGISAFGLAQRLAISRSEAASIIQQYFEQYPRVKAYMENIVAECRDKGYVETMSGRKRWIRDIKSSNGTIRSGAERTAINTPIQGTAADMIKMAMVRIDAQLRSRGMKTTMLLQVHDELLFDLWPGERDEAVPLIVDGMKTALPLKVPVEVQTGTGGNWLAAH